MPNLGYQGLGVSDKKIFKNFQYFLVLLLLQPEFRKESNSFKKF